jgi:hypothetical protein
MLRGADKWLPGYLSSVFKRPRRGQGPCHLLVCVADHFEPFDKTILPDGSITGGVRPDAARGLVESWCEQYVASLEEFRDSDGLPPRHTFFYPWDEYDPGCLDLLGDFCRQGFGEVEIHLHHRNDTESGFREKLIRCRDTYSGQHGLLGRSKDGLPAYAFVHGNWCLCNSRPDGDWCGVGGELAILKETGCFADLTFPSAPSPTQPGSVNTLYYGRDPLPGESGPQVKARVTANGRAVDGVLMIPGPLGLNWYSRKWGVLPRLENGEVSGSNPASIGRLRLWRKVGVHVPGRPEWVVIKLHTHGADPANRESLLGSRMVEFHRSLAGLLERDEGCRLHYVTARELFNILKAAEAGCEGDPTRYREYLIRCFDGAESSVDES